MKMQQITLGVVVLVLLLGLGVFAMRNSMNWYGDNSLPTDAALDKEFRQREADLELLVKMARVDYRVVRIASDFTWLDNNAGWPRPESELGFSQERWQEYRSLFKKLNLDGGILQETQGEIIYLISAKKGMVTNGTLKGYAYSVKELEPILQSLDDPTAMPKGKRVAFKRLKEHWYLFYMSA